MAAAQHVRWGITAALLALSAGLALDGPREFSVVTHAQTPATVGQWSQVQQWPVEPVHMQLLPTGKVLFWPYTDEPKLWDPQTGGVTAAAAIGFNPFCSGHAFMADGRLFVAGGHIANNVGLPTAATYNAFTNTWTRLPNMNAGRWYPTVTTLPNGDMFVISGDIDTTVGTNYLPQVWEVAAGRWRNLVNAQIWVALYPPLFLAPNGQIFVAGPHPVTRYINPAGAGNAVFVAEAAWGYRDYGTWVMYEDGKILMAGGGDPPTATVEVIDLNAASPAWTTVAPMAFARRQLNSTILPDGNILITGGSSGPGFDNGTAPVLATELWNPTTRQFTRLADAARYRGYHSTALLLPDARVLSAGSVGSPDAQVFSPPYLFKSARPTITSAPASITYGQSFFVGSPEAASVVRATWIRLGSVTHSFNMDQRINRLSFSQATGGLQVVAPTDPNLTPPGYYMLFLLNADGVPSVARIITIGPAVIPAAPTSLTASAVSSTQINLSWTDNATNETGFEIQRSLDGTTFTPLTTVAANVTTHSNTGLSASTTYHYRVRATNATGPSGWSNVATAQTSGTPTAPAAPTNLTATPVSSNQINLSWTDNAANETGFEIQRSLDGTTFTPLTTVAANVTTYSNTGLSASTTYHYRVRATNGVGPSTWSNVANAQTSATPTAPAAPTNLTATPVSSSQINLSWTDNASNETGFEIERSLDGTTFAPLTTVAANVTTFANTGLNGSTTYHYRVRATNGVGPSTWSNVASAQTSAAPTAPAAPSNLIAAAPSDSQIDLTWTDNASNETGFQIERSLDGSTFTPLVTVGANVTAYTNTGLAPSTRYWYRVRAINAVGASPWSNVDHARTKR